MRAVGNWVAGNMWIRPAAFRSRKLLEYMGQIVGDGTRLPSADALDALLAEVDNKQNTPHQLIMKMKEMLAPNSGNSNNVPTP